MRRQKYIQTFELLAAILSRFEEDAGKWTPFLSSLGEYLKEKTNETIISEVVAQSISIRSGKNKFDSDKLFVSYSDLDLIYSNLAVLDLKERLVSYMCIAGWFEEFNFSISDENILKKVLNLKDEHIELVKHFFSPNEKEISLNNNTIFVLRPFRDEYDSLEGKWIESNRPRKLDSINFFEFENLKENLKVLFCDDLKLFFIRTLDGKERLNKSGQQGLCSWEIIEPGEVMWIDDDFNIDFHTLKKRFLHEKYASSIYLSVHDLSYHYANGRGVQTIGFEALQGAIIGVMGKEGAGKSTLLKLLAGELSGYNGQIEINGYNLAKELYNLKGMLGFVPEEDLLFDELSVYDNLHLAAKLYYAKVSANDIKQRTDKLLQELDLYAVRDVIVGSTFSKGLQPGQRRLLNIAMEMIREPSILIVDNGISALSPVESDQIIQILSHYAFKGRIVITSIAQTSGRSLHNFDEVIILDEGGLPVYSGKSTEIYPYFSNLFKLGVGDPEEDYGADELLEIINSRKRSEKEYGSRYFSPWELHAFYLENIKTRQSISNYRKILPAYFIQPPTLDRQYVLFGIRNFKTKLARSRDLLFTLISSPLLALIICLILRRSESVNYSFLHNNNIPPFFFLSLLTAVFIGLVQSSNEILREKNIYKKHEYHNLSRFSYINSKITYLFIIGLLQSFLFVSVGSLVLQIRGMFFLYWLVIFSAIAFGLLTGLLLSSLHKILLNLLTKSIPIIMILQILFGGGFIDYKSIGFSKRNFPPLVADLMVTRWGYEALVVYQFRKNGYEKNFYRTDRIKSNSDFYSNTLIPLLKTELEYCNNNLEKHPDSINVLLNSIRTNLEVIRQYPDIFPYENIDKLNSHDFSKEISTDLQEYLEYLDLQFYSQSELATRKQKAITDSLNKSDPINNTGRLKKLYQNNAIVELVKNTSQSSSYQYYNGMIIQLSDPIFQHPTSEIGRTPMFYPEKKFKGQIVNTPEFDISVIWLINLILYILIISDLLKRIHLFHD